MKGKQASVFMRVTQSDFVRTFALDIFSGLFICALLSPLLKKKRLKRVVRAKIVSMRGPAQDITSAPALLCEGKVRMRGLGAGFRSWPRRLSQCHLTAVFTGSHHPSAPRECCF